NRRCSSASARRTFSSSRRNRDMASGEQVQRWGRHPLAGAAIDLPRIRLPALRLFRTVAVRLRGLRLDPSDDGVDQLSAGPTGYAVGELLVVERGKRLTAAA